MALPFLLIMIPTIIVAYVLFQLYGPVGGKPKSIIRSVPIGEDEEREGAPHRNIKFKTGLVVDKDGLTTIPQLMRATFEKYGSHPAMGVRPTIKIEEKDVTVQVDGKPVTKKFKIPWLGPYKFKTFTELGNEITNFGCGLMDGTEHALKFGDKISIFAGTRPEWQVAAQSAFENGLAVVTVYPSLGPDALGYSLDQTRASHLITQVSLLETVAKTVPQLSGHLKSIIYMDDLTPEKHADLQKKCGIELISYKDVMTRGEQIRASGKKRVQRSPDAKDLAVIMYTSGSTGQPKGVMMSHANVVASCGGIGAVCPVPISETDTYIAYLPLAHVLELTAEMTVLAYGGSLGYSSPLTLKDDGACDENGRPSGDLAQLKPTLMAAVPLILDRLRVAIQDQVAKSNPITRFVFNTAFAIKKRRYLAGSPSPILDRLVFKKVAAKFGGRVRYLLSGGAPLSPETHEFINITMCAPVMQGYGLTETMSGGTITHPDDRTTGNAGAPVACCQIKLVDEPEMGYTHLDKPKPRGQIFIGGPNVTMGYFNDPKQTEEAYFTCKNGFRYFATGDIGQWEEDGTLKIIDRKKDLVKLNHGEYIAVGNLESKYVHAPLVENICMVGDSHHGAPIALVVPHHVNLLALARENGITGDVEQLCKDSKIVKLVLQALLKEADDNKLEKWERIAAIKLYPDAWLPGDLLTEAMKLKRHEIMKRFKADIDALYKTVP